jgi:sigma-E factor negative regulatory protein RseA
MEKISQMMDGELDDIECRLQIQRLGQDAALAQSWETFHLIRDVLRDEASTGPDLARRVRERLTKEPTVIAPRRWLGARIAHHTLPIAAAVAGVMVVGWLALSLRPAIEPVRPVALQAPPVVPLLATVSANGQMNEYLLAHQEYSPSTAMQGVASYIRTVASRESDSAR